MPCKKPYILKLKSPLDTWKQELLGKNPLFIAVPCGKCADCLAKKARDLFVRAYAEVKERPASYFVTLTYNEEYLPYTKNFMPTLLLDDFQRFLKRMRKNNKVDICYIGCGEYGDLGKRPHYHFILMFKPFISPEECYNMIEKAWFKGCRIHIAPAEPATIHYVLKYMIKDEIWNDVKKDDKSYPTLPFAKWSKQLGLSMITPVFAKYIWQRGEFVVYVNGIKYGLPKYLRDKLFESGYLRYSQMMRLLKDNFNLMWDFDNNDLDKYKKQFGDKLGFDYYRMSADIYKEMVIKRKKLHSSL